jgi:hypothetical protein
MEKFTFQQRLVLRNSELFTFKKFKVQKVQGSKSSRFKKFKVQKVQGSKSSRFKEVSKNPVS